MLLDDGASLRGWSPPSRGRYHRGSSSSNPHGRSSSSTKPRGRESAMVSSRGRKTTAIKKLLAGSEAGTSRNGQNDIKSSFRRGYYSPATNLYPLE
jgi:hypothetical protein